MFSQFCLKVPLIWELGKIIYPGVIRGAAYSEIIGKLTKSSRVMNFLVLFSKQNFFGETSVLVGIFFLQRVRSRDI